MTVPSVHESYFHSTSALPPDLKQKELYDALTRTALAINIINNGLAQYGVSRLDEIIQGNNFSGIVSNILTDALNVSSSYKRLSDQAYPDMIGPTCGLEIKATSSASKGAESHNGHSGWHMIASYTLVEGHLIWTCIKSANLIAFGLPDSDWTYCGSARNEQGSQRTETYSTSGKGRAKLLEGMCYLDVTYSPNWRRWRGSDNYVYAPWSIMASRSIPATIPASGPRPARS